MRIFTKLLNSRSSFKIGDVVKETRIITQQDLDLFSNLTGDHNPIHKNNKTNEKPIVHGAFLNSIVAGIIGTKLPGPGTIVISQNFTFHSKCYPDSPIEITVELCELRKIMKVKYACTQNSIVVFQGESLLTMIKKT